MNIVDDRNNSPMRGCDLAQGEVYCDTYGNCVLMTDENMVVSLSDGVTYCLKDSYSEDDIFIPLKVRLVIE